MKRTRTTTRTTTVAVHSTFAFGLVLASVNVLAGAVHDHGGHGTSSQEQAFGKPGDPKRISRAIEVDMTDRMRFDPSDFTVKQGETIRFVVSNKGELDHEMVLGTMEELKSHGASMRANPDISHDDPSAARVAPGRKKDLIWQFSKAGDFYFACLIPGHFEAGMVGKIKVMKG